MDTIILLSYFFAFYFSVLSTGVNEENKLMELLKSGLPRFSPPHDMENKTVMIYTDLYQIIGIDEKHGVFTAKFLLYFYYNTPSAKWDPREYNGTSVLTVPPFTFWTPDIGMLFYIMT